MSAGTRFQNLVNQDCLLGYRNIYNGVLTNVDHFNGIRILNQNLVEIGFINPADIQQIDVGIYQAIAPASLFTSAGIYHDVWEVVQTPSSPQQNYQFDIAVYVVPPAPQQNFGIGGVLECSLDNLNACMLKNNYLWPVWCVLSNGYYVSDYVLQFHIDAAITSIQRMLGIPLRHVRVRTQPYSLNLGPTPVLGVDFDEQGDLLQWNVMDSEHWSSIRLPHSNILRVISVRGIYNGRSVYNIPDDWVSRNEIKSGWVRIRPTTAGSIANIVDGSGRFLDLTLLEALGTNMVPGFWAVDYDYGSEGGRFPKEICDLIMKKAAVTLLNQIGQAISRGVANRQASVDGLSTSIGFVANAERTMFGALSATYELDLSDSNILEMRRFYKGPTVFII